ncbi:PAS domain S-box protein [Curvibacter sp. APW13]|uniref:ATP-binding protein n=1 Tax=Curvibacter sp. APW13 TaxID=3077236 RepID=UPI0028DF47C3|nr:ATP-binding protein [Curvibacter sp. APW13]MDT8992512.1 PAS domain S-box protein [Curvibacter sp. APW13]
MRHSTWPRGLLWLCAAGLAVWLIAQAGLAVGQREAQALEGSMRRAAEVNTLAVRSVVEKYKYLPYTVAQHPSVVRALESPPGKGSMEASRYLQAVNAHAASSVLYLMNAHGVTLHASNWERPDSFVGKDYSARPYFTEAMRGQVGLFYAVGKDTGEPGLFLAAPVHRGAAVLGVVAVKVSLGEIEATWRDAGTPLVLSDAFGVVFLGSAPPFGDLGLGKERRYVRTRALTASQDQWLQDHYVYGRKTHLEPAPWAAQPDTAADGFYFVTGPQPGAPRFLALDHPVFDAADSFHTLGWTLTVMADYGSVVRERNSAWLSASLAAALLAMAGLYWQARERRFREVRQASQELERRVQERTQELGDAHAFRKAMEDSLLVGMRARDLEGHIIYVNPAHAQITGYSADELLGKLPPYPYWHPQDVERHWHNSDAALQGKADLTGWESRLRHKDGHDVYTMVYTAPLIDAQGQHRGWMSSVVDISQQKQSEALQRQQLEQLQHAQRLASMGEIASTIGHELNQPLEAIGNFASAARAFAQQGNASMLDSSLVEVQQQIQRAAGILQRIKTIGKRETPGQEPLQLNTIVHQVQEWVAPQAQHRKTRIATRLDSDQPPVLADGVLLAQVVLNLVMNALQSMEGVPPEQRCVEIASFHDAQHVTLEVRDHGPGVAGENKARIFEPFFTTKPEGLGLGLNICRTIVEGHRGSLTVHNHREGGAVFTLQLERLS